MQTVMDDAPTLTVEAVEGGALAVFPESRFFGAFADGGREALHTTLELVREQMEEALMDAKIETLPAQSVSEWRIAIDVEESGQVKVRKLFLKQLLAQSYSLEGLLFTFASALTVLMAKTVVFV